MTAASLVERAGKYVEAYEKEFSAVVCEERQVQRVMRADGRVRQTRELKSDFLLVKAGGVWMQAFRDVLEVDGKPIRNREDRLRKLFLGPSKTALDQARAIAKESGRYNIGPSRTGNSPLLPIRILNPRLASGFHFALSGVSLTFDEFRSPSYLSRQGFKGRQDMMSHGSFVIDADSGRVLAAELTADGPPSAYTATVKVQYREDPQLKLLVPSEMHESYWRPGQPKDDRIEVAVSYSNFRRFQVTVDETIIK